MNIPADLVEILKVVSQALHLQGQGQDFDTLRYLSSDALVLDQHKQKDWVVSCVHFPHPSWEIDFEGDHHTRTMLRQVVVSSTDSVTHYPTILSLPQHCFLYYLSLHYFEFLLSIDHLLQDLHKQPEGHLNNLSEDALE